jgi:lysyl-tRNA synthetase, class II
MGREKQIVNERIRKVKELRENGVNPYPAKFNKKYDVGFCLKSKLGTKVKTAGRLMMKRDLGKISFGTLMDFSGQIQIVLQDKKTPQKIFDLFKKYVDSGDFVGLEGEIIKTKTGQLSILVKKFELLTKSILPLPSKWHGLKDEEERYRKRYVDMIMNPELKQVFVKKALFWNSMRTFLLERNFVEVETPVLETTAGGAAAEPFATHHNALDMDVYLRISMGELWQKKLMVAGFDKTFEIGRQFRNEGMDAEHLQDYTQMEFYWGYANYEDGMKLVKEMYTKIAKQVFGKTKFTRNGLSFDLSKKWKIIDYATEIKKHTKLDIFKSSKKDLEKKLDQLKIKYNPKIDKWRLVDLIWKFYRKKIAGPAFLTGQPVEISPLAKKDMKNNKTVQQFQVLLAGSEVGNGYSELNDPFDQEERFERQMELKEQGDVEAQDHDKDFVEALKYGMPPTCGFGVSERLFSFLEGTSIRETVLFPLMKPDKK